MVLLIQNHSQKQVIFERSFRATQLIWPAFQDLQSPVSYLDISATLT